MLSLTSEYALRATLYIASHSDHGPIKLEQIADDLGVPRNYLSKTLHQLARVGVLRSDRGPTGGFRLGRPPEEMTLAEIVFPFDPLRFARRCILGRGQCSDENPCAAHHHWKTVAEPMRTFFSRTTVADLVASEAAATTHPRLESAGADDAASGLAGPSDARASDLDVSRHVRPE